MFDVALVKRGSVLAPYSAADLDAIAGIADSAVIRAKLTAPKKERSYRQLALFWACCREVAENSDDPNWSTPEIVAEQVKLALKHISSWMVTASGTVHIITGSISYQALLHLEACRFFDRAWPILADKIGITVAELHRNTEEQLRWAATEHQP